MKRTKKRQDIKSKLIAAICMLMVSVIMLASSSYAWFTLSTAPEVKGLQANVGANGNLEIALLGTANSYNSPAGISSAEADSSAAEGKNALTANLTWGNLIDLSHESYGLGMITLKPAALNTTGDVPVVGQTIAAQMLKVPMYGADGRVTKLDYENTILAPYNNTKKAFSKVDTDTTTNAAYDPAKDIEYGLRAIGSSTNRSIREITYSTNMSQANQLASIAKSDAVTSLNAYGAVLADIGIQGGMYGDSTTFDKNVLDNLQAMLNSIVGYVVITGDAENPVETPVEGITDKIEQALESYLIAAVASGLNGEEYANDEEFTTTMEGLTADKAAELIGTEAAAGFAAADDQLDEIVDAAAAAQTKLNDLKDDNKATYTFAELKPVLASLFDTSTMTVCGLTVAEIKDEGGKGKLMTAYGEYNNQIVVDMKGGIYSEIADLTDTFSGRAQLDIPELDKTWSTMQANRTQLIPRGILGGISAQVAAELPPKGASSNPVISDAYGYVVDMAFRTNASDSKLLLQTAAEARISGADDDTMGGGSTMTFTSVEGFSAENMKKLMAKIKIVFFKNDGSNEILAVAGLDTADPTTVTTATTVTAPLKIKTDSGFATDANAVIYDDMPTNIPVKISALVYLDGTSISNGDVGTGALSMTGRLNLQFSSSATLTPMDYSAGFAPANPVVDATTP